MSNYNKALRQLEKAVEISKEREITNLEKQGLIKAFEFTHELAWNVINDYFEYQGSMEIIGSRDATPEAFNKGLIDHGETWMKMVASRNQTSHTYNEEIADQIAKLIINEYQPLFKEFQEKMEEFRSGLQGDIFEK